MGGAARGAKAIALGASLSTALAALLATCAKPARMPALDGALIEIRRSDAPLQPDDPGYATTLQLYWFGTACHLIKFGELSILTDPFVTNELRLLNMRSNPERVEATLGQISPPDAVLINHSHHDHILDAHAAMSQPTWGAQRVPLYGGTSAVNLLAGYNEGAIDPRWHTVQHERSFEIQSGSYRAKVTPHRSAHSPHLKCGLTLANGTIPQPRTTPPRKFADFQSGESFNYLVEMSAPDGTKITVFYLGTPFDIDELPNSLPPAGTEIDVALILAPSADNVRGYPEEHIAHLQPRHIVLSHFNTFMKEDPDEQLVIGPLDTVKMRKLSRDLQSTFARNRDHYPEFEKLHIPAITMMKDGGNARNVLLLQ